MALFGIALRNVMHRRLRSWLTILGILIGVVALVSLISLSQGLKDAVRDEFARVGADKIIITPASVGTIGSGSSAKLGEDDVKRIERVRGVSEVTYALFRTGKTTFGKRVKFPFVSGLELDQGDIIWEEFDFMNAVEGRVIRPGDKDNIVVGYNFRFEKVFPKDVRVGNSLEIEGRDFKVVGVLDKVGDPGVDGGVIMTIEAMEELFGLEDEYDQIYAKTSVGEIPSVVSERIERSLRSFRDVEERKEDFQVQTPEDIADQLFSILDIISAVLIGIAFISLIVGGVGIMNTMYTSVLERTNEIGVMKAVGAKNSDILFIFISEAGLLGLVGGVMGVAIGVAIGQGVAFFGRVALGTNLIQASYSPWLIFGSLAFAFFVGAASGILPSWQAARMRPVESLRY